MYSQFQLNESGNLKLRVTTLGQSPYPILVADNIFSDPVAVRNSVLRFNTDCIINDGYPGQVNVTSLDLDNVLTLLSRLAGRYGLSDQKLRQGHDGLWGISTVGSRSRHNGPIKRAHVDPHLFQIVIFLNLPDQCRGGTAFYTHSLLKTELVVSRQNLFDEAIDLIRNPQSQISGTGSKTRVLKKLLTKGFLKQAKELVDANLFESESQYFRYIKQTLDVQSTDAAGCWLNYGQVKMVFNRLICFPGFLVHAVDCQNNWFSDDPHSQRLTLNSRVFWPE